MLGAVIVTHGKMSEGIVDATELIVGSVENIETISLYQEDNVDNLGLKIKEAIEKVNQNNGVIVFVDLLSASPYNQSLLAINNLNKSLAEQVYVVAGVNLPMVLEFVNQQILESSVDEAIEKIINKYEQGTEVWSIKNLEDEDDDDNF